jgi:hypothetical protein
MQLTSIGNSVTTDKLPIGGSAPEMLDPQRSRSLANLARAKLVVEASTVPSRRGA